MSDEPSHFIDTESLNLARAFFEDLRKSFELNAPLAIAPCDIGPDDVLTLDFTAPLADRIVKVERDGVVIYEATK